MPIYNYHCGNCGNEAEYLVPKYDVHPQKCINCGPEGRLERMIAPLPFSVSGKGETNPNQKPSKVEDMRSILRATGAEYIGTFPAPCPKHADHLVPIDVWKKKDPRLN